VIAVCEILVHASLVTYVIGWESGFFYYTLAIIPLVFLNPTLSTLLKFTTSILISSFFISLKYFASTHPPLLQINMNILNNLYYMNGFFISSGIALLVYYFSLASDMAEHKIEQERHKADFANKSKSAFLANMSHELRTPLNAIIGYSEMLKDEADEKGNKQDSKDLTKITNAGNHLLTLINSILDLTKIEAGKTVIDYQQVDINSLLNEVVSMMKPMINKRKNTLIIHCDESFGSICTDQTKIKQILFNLLSNANKFTNNGTIDFSIYTEDKNNQEWLCFNITDTGIGIPNHKIEELFQPFVQADISTTRLYGGTGLGLTIIKHFITLMKGVIHVESVINKGTSFIVELPVLQNKCS
jgi:signal transduction histidine kinase